MTNLHMNYSKGMIAIHCSVLLMGGAGLFAKFLSLPSHVIVCSRTLIAAITLVILLPLMKTPIKLQKAKDLPVFILMGCTLAIHWVTFFYAIQISTVAVGILSFSTFPIFVTFLEPLFFKERLQSKDILTSIIVFSGLILVVPNFDPGNNITLGVIWGTVSGFTFALLSIFNRKYVVRYSALTLAFYQDLIACILLLPFAWSQLFTVTTSEIYLLLLLGIVFTAGSHSLFIQGMTTVKAQLASVVSCLEPVYGIIFAVMLLHEEPSSRELLGGLVIIGTVFFSTKNAQKSTIPKVT